ncbi:MAG: hypothetical protein CFE45_43270, partial [Burkholderiales bacterium PBB5]
MSRNAATVATTVPSFGWPDQLRGLLQREWLQQRRGWTFFLLTPSLLVLLLAAFGQVQMDVHNDAGDPELQVSSQALLLTAGLIGGLMLAGLVLALALALLQASGLARRDAQDRSIEFWRSLPVADSLALAAPLLAQLLLLPLAALAVDAVGGLLASAVAVGRTDGLVAWLSLPWGTLALAAVALGLRLALGLVLALLWEIAPRTGLADATFLPPLSEVLLAGWDLARNGQLTEHVGASLFRALAGFLIALAYAIPLGLAIGWWRRVADGLNPLLEVLRS